VCFALQEFSFTSGKISFSISTNLLPCGSRLVNRLRLQGKSEVGAYFHRYAETKFWRFVSGMVDGSPAVLVCDADDPASPSRYFVLLDWRGAQLAGIRDCLFARYAIEGAEVLLFC
jgi:RNA polymerase sigma-70 factor, ECF subfamily